MIEGLAFEYNPPGPGGPMIKLMGLPPGAPVPAVARKIVRPETVVPQWVIAPSIVTAPPGAMFIVGPEALKSDVEAGTPPPKLISMSLTS